MERWLTTASSGAPPSAVGGKNIYYVYILKSEKNDKYYTGSTGNVFKRLRMHNSGKNKSTRLGIPWRLVCQEEFATKQEAYRREMQIKRYKGGEAFKNLIKD